MAAPAFTAVSNEHATSSALAVKKACKYEFKPVAQILKELEHSTLPSLTSGDPCFETSSERRARVDFSTLPSLTSGDPSFGPGPSPTQLANVKEMAPQASAPQKNTCADIAASSPCPPRSTFKVLDGLKEMMAAANITFSPLPLSMEAGSTPALTAPVVAAPSLPPSHSTPVKSPHVFSTAFAPANKVDTIQEVDNVDASFSIDSPDTLCIEHDPKINASFWGENFDGHLACPYDWSVYTILETGNDTAEVQRRFWKKKLADDLEEFNRTRTFIEDSFDEAPIIEQPTNDVAAPQAKAKFMPRRNPKVAIAPSDVKKIPSSSYVVPSARVSSRMAAAAEGKTSELVTTHAKQASVRATVAPGKKSTTVARTTPTASRVTSTKSTTVAAGKTGRVGPQRITLKPKAPIAPIAPPTVAAPTSKAAALKLALEAVPRPGSPLEECCLSCYLWVHGPRRVTVYPKPAPVVKKPAPVVKKPAPVVKKPAPVVKKSTTATSRPAVAAPAFARPTAASFAKTAAATAAKSAAVATKPAVATTTRRNIRTASKVTQTTTRK